METFHVVVFAVTISLVNNIVCFRSRRRHDTDEKGELTAMVSLNCIGLSVY